MKEFYSRAIVLERRDVGEVDGIISLFTEDFGKILAWAKSVKKIKSKLSAHLQPLTFIKIRLIQRPGPRNGWAIVDCMRDDDFSDFETSKRYDILPIIYFLNHHLFEFQPDRNLWAFLRHIFLGKYDYSQTAKTLLTIMGFDLTESSCAVCSSKLVAAFHGNDQVFLCAKCALKFPSDALLLINNKL
jgi:recombinational DNA repair protein (RecF pathway)